jgi:DNA-binding transcriptional LysR family regulator
MDLRHARTFVTVVELGTVSKAALRLRIAQPALSRQIGALERELGLKAF